MRLFQTLTPWLGALSFISANTEQCSCDRGIGLTNCGSTSDFNCDPTGCDPLYHPVTDDGTGITTCELNVCNCLNGDNAVNCTNDGADECEVDGCNDYYHDETTDGITTCVKNVCNCLHGTNAEDCVVDGADECEVDSCNDYYHDETTDGITTCVKNVCNCLHGTNAENCVVDGADECEEDSCLDFYHHTTSEPFVCVANECICTGGTPVASSLCTVHGAEHCSECSDEYEANGQVCDPNECSCPNGTPKGEGACTEDGAISCDACDDGYELADNDPVDAHQICKSKVCPCTRGTGVGKVTEGECNQPFEYQQCESCDIGFKLKTDNDPITQQDIDGNDVTVTPHTCIPEVCDCENGTPQTFVFDTYCVYSKATNVANPGREVCTSCNDYYHLDDTDCDYCKDDIEDGLCVANECDCPDGTPAPAGSCNKHDTIQCIACNNDWQEVRTDVDDYEKCMDKECICDNGTPAIGDTYATVCDDAGANICAECDDFYHIESNDACVLNEANCPNGVAQDEGSVVDHEGHECKSCNSFYHEVETTKTLKDGVTTVTVITCEPNVCYCDNGTKVSNDSCNVHNNEECQSCNNFYHEVPYGPNDYLTCEENECTCPDGTPVDNAICTDHNEEQCSECNDYHHLDGDDHCVDNECYCDHGDPVETGVACVDHINNHSCEVCDDYYHFENGLVGDECVANVCICQDVNGVTHGTPDDITCSSNGANECKACNDAHKKFDSGLEQCIQKSCTCTHGTAAENEVCTDEKEHCVACNDYYHLEGDVCVLNVCKCSLPGSDPRVGDCVVHDNEECEDCNDEGYKLVSSVTEGVESISCEPKVCKCDYGIAVDAGDCTVEGDNQCKECFEYYDIGGDGNDCVENQCKCTGGNPVPFDQCPVNGQERCADCNVTGYDTFDDGTGVITCVANQCTCSIYDENVPGNILALSSGVGTTGTDCPTAGENNCASCGTDKDTPYGFWYHVHKTANDPLASQDDPEWGYCVLNVCHCNKDGVWNDDHPIGTNDSKNGTPKAAFACPEHRGHFCDTCDEGLILDENLHCVNVICNCIHGDGDQSGLCNGGLDYDSCAEDGCDFGYHDEITASPIERDGTTYQIRSCVPNECVCQDGQGNDVGVGRNNGSCSVDGANECVKDQCDAGWTYNPNGNGGKGSCDPNQCVCENDTLVSGTKAGTGLLSSKGDGVICSAPNANECASCDEPYFIVDDSDSKVCNYKTCSCNYVNQPNSGVAGTPKGPGECTVDVSVDAVGANQCSDCSTDTTYYKLENDLCTLKICECSNGDRKVYDGSDPNSGCTDDGDDQCSACDLYYHMSDGSDTDSCFINVCRCDEVGRTGTATANGLCPTHNQEHCSECDDAGKSIVSTTAVHSPSGTTYVATSICEQNVCVCDNGTKAENNDCTTDDANICTACNDGYHLNTDTKACDPNVCQCAGGASVTTLFGAGHCPKHNANVCAVCYNSGQKLFNCDDSSESDTCISGVEVFCENKTCACDNGTGISDGTCTNESDNICASCNTDNGYHLEEVDRVCEPGCICPNGTPVDNTDCPVPFEEKCSACEDNYQLIDEKCVPYVCNCIHGVDAEAGDCSGTGNDECKSCNEFYHLSDGPNSSCVENVCECDIGTAAPNSECDEHESQQCTACNDFGWEVDTLKRCMPKLCQCPNGVGIHDGTCMSEKIERCLTCNAGYHLKFVEVDWHYLLYEDVDGTGSGNGRDDVDGEESYFHAEHCVALACNDWEKVGDVSEGTQNQCVPKVCQCSFGDAAEGQDCVDEDLTENCVACDAGYELVGTECQSVFTCVCDNGVPASGDDCTEEGGHICESCDLPGFYVNPEGICDTKVCQCVNGKGVHDGTCYNTNWNHCEYCNPGFHIQYSVATAWFEHDDGHHFFRECISDLVANPNPVCSCSGGVPAEGADCTEDKAEKCMECYSPAYKLVNNECVPKECPCTDGTGATHGACLDESVERCDTCNQGFHRSFGENNAVICVADVNCQGNTHAAIDSAGSVICADNECLCPNGVPDNANCANHLDFMCASCDEGYELEGDFCSEIVIEPVENVCVCQYGRAAVGDDCPNNGDTHCMECYSDGYKLVNHQCVAKVCPCTRGNGATNGQCVDESVEKCCTCDVGYHLALGEGNCEMRCEANLVCSATQHATVNADGDVLCADNQCFCPYGTAAAECSTHLAFECDSCDEGFETDSKGFCVPVVEDEIVCTCNGGVAATGDACTNNGDQICVECYNVGDKLENGLCVPKVCKCTDGLGVRDGTCVDESIEKCLECNEDFHLAFAQNDDHTSIVCNPDVVCDGETHVGLNADGEIDCEDNVCFCNNGTPAAICAEHMSFACDACDDGFEMVGNFCVQEHVAAEVTCSAGYQKECSDSACQCVAKTCACTNGVGVSYGMCYDSSIENCAFCEEGYNLVYQVEGNNYFAQCEEAPKEDCNISRTCEQADCNPGEIAEDGVCEAVVARFNIANTSGSSAARSPMQSTLSVDGVEYCLGLLQEKTEEELDDTPDQKGNVGLTPCTSPLAFKNVWYEKNNKKLSIRESYHNRKYCLQFEEDGHKTNTAFYMSTTCKQKINCSKNGKSKFFAATSSKGDSFNIEWTGN